MPTKLFLELNEEKRAKIIGASMAEFAQCGYANGSTNRIVRNAGISKGSLFKYFQNKDELYFYILDAAVQELTVSLEREVYAYSRDLFERIIQYAEMEFAWYIAHPEKCRLITSAFTKSDTAIYQKIEARYGERGRDIYDALLEGIDASPLRLNKKKTADMIRWFLKGFNEDFVICIETRQDKNIDILRREYMESLTDYMVILQSGLVAEEKGDGSRVW